MSERRMLIGLVACCKEKRGVPNITARQQYVSDLFNKATDYCDFNYDGYFILSAKYGLVHPCECIDLYDLTLNDMSRKERLAWGKKVYERLRDRFHVENSTFYLHAGENYCEGVLPYLNDCHRPLEGLGIGEQKAWYNARFLQWEKTGCNKYGYVWTANPLPNVQYEIRERVQRWSERGKNHCLRSYWLYLTVDGQKKEFNAWDHWDFAQHRADKDWGLRQREMALTQEVRQSLLVPA